MFCPRCGRENVDSTAFCGGCGTNLHAISPQKKPAYQQSAYQQPNIQYEGYPPGYVPKDWLIAILLCVFIGFGSHCLYVGRTASGVLRMVLLILFCLSFWFYGIGFIFWVPYIIMWVIDIVQICTGKFPDQEGYTLLKKF